MDARDRALQRLIEMLTPAAALGIRCDFCTGIVRPDSPHEVRRNAAREMLASDLRVLFEG
jgi:hypothetical protein